MIAFVCALLMAHPAAAFELWGTGPLSSSSVQVTNDFEARFHHVPEKLAGFEDRNIHDYVEQVNRTNLLLTKDGLSIGAQIDEVALFANRYVLDGVEYASWQLYEPDIISPWKDALVTVDKLYLQRRWSHVEVTVGDTYASFGRGIVLNVVKNTDIDVDTSIRGGRLVLRSGDLELTAVSGLTHSQLISQDQPNLAIGHDIGHMVSGVRVDDYGLGSVHVGLHGVLYNFGRAEDADQPALLRYSQDRDAMATGFSLDVPSLMGIDWYAEGDLFGYRGVELTDGADSLFGYAGYVSASAYPGKTVLLIEGKASKNTERINTFVTPEGWEIANIPTLEYERVITEDSSAAVNSNDLVGARLRVDYSARPGELVPYVTVAGFHDADVQSGLHFNASPETIGHGIAGLQWFPNGRVVQFDGGYRQDLREDAAEGSDRMAHVDGEVEFPVLGTESLELSVSLKQFWWGDNVQQQEDFFEMSNTLAWHRGEKLIFMLYQDWSDNPLIRSKGNLADNLYGAAELVWKRTPSSTVRVFYGAYKAGIHCSGGQCRSLPGFDGGRVSWQTVF